MTALIVCFGVVLLAAFACIGFCGVLVFRHIQKLEELALIESKERREYLDSAVQRLNTINTSLVGHVPAVEEEESELELSQFRTGIRRG